MYVARVKSSEALAALAADWNRLAAGHPFRRHEWHAAWWQNYADARREPFVLVVRDDRGAAVGIAPWFVELSTTRGRVLAWLGSGEVCSDYQSILVAPGQLEGVTDALAEWLVRAASGERLADRWDLLNLEAVEAVARLVSHLWSAGSTVLRDEPYKAHWRAAPRETVTYRIVPPRALSPIRHGVWLAGDSVKSWVKTGLELTGMR